MGRGATLTAPAETPETITRSTWKLGSFFDLRAAVTRENEISLLSSLGWHRQFDFICGGASSGCAQNRCARRQRLA